MDSPDYPPIAGTNLPADLGWCRESYWRRIRTAGMLFTAVFGAECIREVAARPAGSRELALLMIAAWASASAWWVAVRRLDVVDLARARGTDFLLRRAHVRSGFFALGCACGFAALGGLEFSVLGLSTSEHPGSGLAVGIAIGLCILTPAVLCTVGETHAAVRRTKHVPRPNGLLKSHWTGRYDLARSFWLHGAGVSVAVVVTNAAAGMVSAMIDLRLSAAVSLILMAACVPVLVWQWVGVWRSATRHRALRRRGTAAFFAKAFVVASSLYIVHFYATGAPFQVRQMVEILQGDPQWDRFFAHVAASGQELVLQGSLQSGCHRVFERALRAAPDVTTVVIDSPGGRLEEGEWIAEEVRERGLRTCAAGDCESAATIVLLSGRQRSVRSGARVGFHSPSLPGAPALLKLAAKFQMEFAMRAAGVSEEFVLRAIDTPPDSMWYPTRPEMLAAGVLTND
jgi:hypothetical protein